MGMFSKKKKVSFLEANAKIYVAGHRGLVGSAIVRCLQAKGFRNLIMQTSKELDLRDQAATFAFLNKEKPEYMFIAAARVGGIMANSTCPAEFIYDNLAIEANLIHGAYRAGIKKLLFLGSTCIYPKMASQPLKEEALLTGPLEETNEWYAIAKIAGIKLCQAYNRQYGTNYIAVMPTNLYGPNDNFDLNSSHVLPAMIRKFHEAKLHGSPTVTLWGSGKPRREFLHVDDLADACLFVMFRHSGSQLLNIGTGSDLTISELAELVKQVVGYQGTIAYDSSMPDGMPLKRSDTSRLSALGWQAKIPLEAGIAATYQWFTQNFVK